MKRIKLVVENKYIEKEVVASYTVEDEKENDCIQMLSKKFKNGLQSGKYEILSITL